MSEPAPIELACASRRDYLPHVATMLSSALANAGAPVRAHLMVGEDVDDLELDALAAMVAEGGGDLVPHRLEAEPFEGMTTTATLPTAHWYRTMLPDLLPGLDRVIYLDADLLVLDSLTDLWGLGLGPRMLAAVTNSFPDPESAVAYCEALGVRPADYFNSGVMLLDLAALRDFGSFERIRGYARAAPVSLILPEQDATCAVLGEHRLPLHPRWNLMTGLIRLPHAEHIFEPGVLAAARERPAIRHFEGSANKPWQRDAPESERELWARYAERVPAHLTVAGRGA